MVILLAAVLGCAPPELDAIPAAVADPEPVLHAWPHPDALLTATELVFPDGFGTKRVYVDAGHGAKGNSGATSAYCEAEQDMTLRVAEGLAERLEATEHFEVVLSRDGDDRVEYRDRVARADAWPADAFLSLHGDARGEPSHWTPAGGSSCPRQDASPGFSVLWSDEGEADRTAPREQLARSLAGRLVSAGFLPYHGVEYEDLYGLTAPGVFVDRHVPSKRILVLRRPAVPSVIVETHHLWDVREAERWRDEATLDAFADAVAAALVDFLA